MQKKCRLRTKKTDFSRLDKIKLPFSIFKHTKLTVFEALVVFLKDKHSLTFRQISQLLDRDERNIWTVYNRGKKKL